MRLQAGLCVVSCPSDTPAGASQGDLWKAVFFDQKHRQMIEQMSEDRWTVRVVVPGKARYETGSSADYTG